MPEATVDENGDQSAGEGDVDRSATLSRDGVVGAVPVPKKVQTHAAARVQVWCLAWPSCSAWLSGQHQSCQGAMGPRQVPVRPHSSDEKRDGPQDCKEAAFVTVAPRDS